VKGSDDPNDPEPTADDVLHALDQEAEDEDDA